MCGRRAPDLPIDVAPRIGKARAVVGQRHSVVQTVVKSESSILMSKGELVWMGFEMGFEKLMLIFCWDAVSLSYSIHVCPYPSPVPRLLRSESIRQRQDRVLSLRIDTSGYADRKSVLEMQKGKWRYHSTPRLWSLMVVW
jgi:hypothetical protein